MSNIIEFNLIVDCPHCGNYQHESVEFNTLSGSESGINSYLAAAECNDCNKKFFFNAYLNFNVEVNEVFKTKPKKWITK